MMLHALAINHCTSLVNKLVQSLPLGCEEEGVPLGDKEGGEGGTSARGQGSPTPDPTELAEVTSEERKEDKEVRIEILLGLLQLACAVVRKG